MPWGLRLLSTKWGRACPPWKHHSLAGILHRENWAAASGLWGRVTSSLRPLLLHLLTRNCELRKPILFPTFLCTVHPSSGKRNWHPLTPSTWSSPEALLTPALLTLGQPTDLSFQQARLSVCLHSPSCHFPRQTHELGPV